jgi:hypothetical protein
MLVERIENWIFLNIITGFLNYKNCKRLSHVLGKSSERTNTAVAGVFVSYCKCLIEMIYCCFLNKEIKIDLNESFVKFHKFKQANIYHSSAAAAVQRLKGQWKYVHVAT